MGTPFTAVYNRFLGKITDDMYLELTPEDTIKDLRNLLKRKEWVILLETPYRLKNILELMQAFAPKRNIVLPFNLTLPDEVVYSGTAGEILKALARDNKEKGEFLLLIEGCR